MQGSVNLANHGLLEFRLVRGLGAGQGKLTEGRCEISSDRDSYTAQQSVSIAQQEIVHSRAGS